MVQCSKFLKKSFLLIIHSSHASGAKEKKTIVREVTLSPAKGYNPTILSVVKNSVIHFQRL